MAFWARPGIISRFRVSARSPTIISALMIHIVRIVFVMLTSQVMSGGGSASACSPSPPVA